MIDPPPQSPVDVMPCDESLLVELGRVTWAAARLHSGVRDAINRLDGAPSDAPFARTLGGAVTDLAKKAAAAGRHDLVTWTRDVAAPAVLSRNAVAHAVTFTAPSGRQAIGPEDFSLPEGYGTDELREVALRLVLASSLLPV